MFRRDADKSEWWRIKMVSVTPESTDTLTLESQFKPLDETGTTMQVVRMRGKMPGQTQGEEMAVPQNLQTLAPTAFSMKPTAESIAGATVAPSRFRRAGRATPPSMSVSAAPAARWSGGSRTRLRAAS
jgi:hypothetical protein